MSSARVRAIVLSPHRTSFCAYHVLPPLTLIADFHPSFSYTSPLHSAQLSRRRQPRTEETTFHKPFVTVPSQLCMPLCFSACVSFGVCIIPYNRRLDTEESHASRLRCMHAPTSTLHLRLHAVTVPGTEKSLGLFCEHSELSILSNPLTIMPRCANFRYSSSSTG